MLKKIFSYAGGYKKNGYIAAILIFLSVFSEITAFYLIYHIINKLISGSSEFSSILIYVVGIFIVYLLKSMLFSFGLDQSHMFAFNTLCNIRKSLAKKLKKMPLGTITNKGAGMYRQNFVDDIESIELLLAHAFPEGLPYVVSSISVYVVLFMVDVRLGLLSLITIPIATVAMVGMMKSGIEKNAQYRTSLIKLNKSIVEYVSGMEVVKVFNKTSISNKKINDSISQYKDFTKEWYKSNFNYMAVFQSVLPSTIAFMLPIGMIMVLNNTMELSTLLFGIILALSISTPLLKVMNFVPIMYNVVKKIEKLEEEFDETELIEGSKDKSIVSSKIDFEHVSFAYDKVRVIDDMSFTINQGEKIGIVGESGSGKSTIGRLIMHYWDVNSGVIKLGGTDIREISLARLMENISYVSQDNFLFNISIKENLLIAKPDADDDEIVAACKAASCHEVIMSLSNGYNTNAGDSGNKLSGGERQRITIARAILKDANIVILDEATSFTDAKNDALINKALENLTKNKTVITVAHKLSNVRSADKIMLIDNGKLIDFAPHDELLNNSIYKNLWERYNKTLDYRFKVKEVQHV
jgi:ABC-type multidrug transport system fused ATPase/permease subunit